MYKIGDNQKFLWRELLIQITSKLEKHIFSVCGFLKAEFEGYCRVELIYVLH